VDSTVPLTRFPTNSRLSISTITITTTTVYQLAITRPRWSNAVPAIGPSPQVQLHNTFTYSIDQAISASSNLDFIAFKFAH
jgi:hypothetical protein